MPARPLALGLRGPNRVAIGRVRRMVAALRRLGGNLWMVDTAFSGAFVDNVGTTPVTAYADLLGLTTDRLGVMGPELVPNPDTGTVTPGGSNPPSFSTTTRYGLPCVALGFNLSGVVGYASSNAVSPTFGPATPLGTTLQIRYEVAMSRALVGSETFQLYDQEHNIYLKTITASDAAVASTFIEVRMTAPTTAGAGSPSRYAIYPGGTFSGGPVTVYLRAVSFKQLTGSHATQSAVASKATAQRVPKRIGVNLLTDGSFDDASKWTSGAGWTVTGGNAVATAVASGVNVLPSTGGYTPTETGKSYKSEVVITAVSAGGVQLIIWNGSTNVANTQTITAPGTYSLTYTANNTQCRPYLSAQGASTSLSAASLSNSEVLEWANVISFDGNNDFLTTGITTGNEGFVAAGVTFTDSNSTVACSGAGSNGQKGVWLYRTASDDRLNMLVGDGVLISATGALSTVTAGTPTVVSGGWTPTTQMLSVDNTETSKTRTNGDASPSPQTLRIGAYHDGTTYAANGSMHAIVYSVVFPDAATRKVIYDGLAALQGRKL